MKELKVYKNYLKGSYCSGILLVAAHDEEEAHKTCLESPELKNIYWEYEGYSPDTDKVEGQLEHYPWHKFEEIQGLTYKGEPCVLEEKHYIE